MDANLSLPYNGSPDLSVSDATSLDSGAPGISDIVTANQKTNEPWYDTLSRVLPMIQGTINNQQFLQLQIDRAKQGLPPLNLQQYTGQAASTANPNAIYWVAGAALVALAFSRRRA